MSKEAPLLHVEGLWKKYCKDLKSSLKYGVFDVANELVCRSEGSAKLRNKEFWALKDVSFELRKGETLGILGKNGAGKSTLLKLLHGVIKPTRGRITVNGSMQALIELGGAFSPMLTGRENIVVSAAVLGIPKKQILPRIDEIIQFSELGDFIDAPVATYSTGMRVRLGFSVAMFIQPEILILDEVLSVGDMAFQAKSLDRVAEIRERAGGVIFVSHNINQIRRLCTKCLLLSHGNLVMIDHPDIVIDAHLKGESNSLISGSEPTRSLVNPSKIELLNWGINQKGMQVKGELDNGPFKIWFHLRINEEMPSTGLDIGLFNDAMQPIVSQTSQLTELTASIGEKLVSIEFPNLNLAPRQYYPYLSICDQRTLQKTLKFIDSLGFNISGEALSGSLLQPQLNISMKALERTL